MELSNQERIDLLEDARALLYQAIDLIGQAVRGTPNENYAHAYSIPSLRMCASAEHGYLGRQPANIDTLIRALSDEDDDEEEIS